MPPKKFTRRRSSTRTTYWSLLFLLWSLVLCAGPVLADPGVGWIAGQAKTDGSIASASDISLPHQATAEALRAFRAVGETAQPVVPAARQYLTDHNLPLAEFLARRLIDAVEWGGDTEALAGELLALQNPDSGFGDRAGFDSTVIDTAFAVEALGVASLNTDAIGRALGYLIDHQQADGSWRQGTNESAIYPTALATRALWEYRHAYDLNESLSAATGWLLAQLAATGVSHEPYEIALALIAVLPTLTDKAPVLDAIAALRDRQLADGSWEGDVYASALAVRALELASRPGSNPDLVKVSGRLVDDATGEPLVGVSVTLSTETQEFVTETDANGVFEVTGLVRGDYTLEVSRDGYGRISSGLRLVPGQDLELGALTFGPVTQATSGVVHGIVTRADTGDPLSNVRVSVNGQSVFTGANGSYEHTSVNPGSITAKAEHPEFFTSVGTAQLQAGDILIFSPQLVRRTELPTVLTGIITDAVSGVALKDATVTLSGANFRSALTDSDGRFHFEALSAGDTRVEVALSGYGSASGQVAVELNKTYKFSPGLYPLAQMTSGVVRGTITDAETGRSLEGVRVSVSEQSVVTGAVGSYELTSVNPGSITLKAEHAEYFKSVEPAQLQAGDILVFSPQLVRRVEPTTSLTGVVTDAVSGAVLQDATVTLSGANSGSAVTDAGGRYHFEALSAGDTVIEVALSGYGGATGQMSIEPNKTYEFSPALYSVSEDVNTPCGMVTASGAPTKLDNKGTEFILAFAPNYDGSWAHVYEYPVELHLTAETSTAVTVQYPVNEPVFEKTVAVKPGETTIVTLPGRAQWAWIWGPGEIRNNAVRVFSEKEVVVYMINRRHETSDAALALPVDTFNTDYVVMDFEPLYYGQFIVYAAYDNTTVTITPANELNNAGSAPIGRAASVPFDVVLNRGEAYLGESIRSLTGTIISADRSVGVLNGNNCTFIPSGTRACDTIFEVAQPVQTWGTSMIAADLPLREGSFYRIIAAEDGTTVSQDGAVLQTLNRGEYLQTPALPGAHVFAGDKPIFVTQYMPGRDFPGSTLGDPSMGNVIPTAQYQHTYTFATVGGDQFDQHFVTVIAEDSDVDTITLDDEPIGGSVFTTIPGTGFSYTSLPLSEGTHTTASDGVHGITVQGYAEYDSYLYPGGASFKVINAFGDETPPICTASFESGDVPFASGSARDDRPGEDLNGDGVLDPGEDLNGNGVLDRDTGIYSICPLEGASNLKLTPEEYTPADPTVSYRVDLIDPDIPGSGVVRVSDGGGNTCTHAIDLAITADCQSPGVPDLTLGQLRVLDDGAGQAVSLVARVGNAGGSPIAAGKRVAFYQGDPAEGGVLLGTVETNEILPHAYEDVVLAEVSPARNDAIFAVADPEGTLAECNLENNQTSVPFTPSASMGTITVTTDRPQYAAHTSATLSAEIHNPGRFVYQMTAELMIEDTAGVVVVRFPVEDMGAVAPGETKNLVRSWTTGATLAGAYELRGILRDTDGNVVSQARTSFAIVHESADVPAVSLRVTTDRPVYDTTDRVAIGNLVRNLTENMVVADGRIEITVFDPMGQAVFTETLSVGEVLPNTLRKHLSVSTLTGAKEGAYRVVAKLYSGEMLMALAETAFSVVEALERALSGTVTVSPQQVDRGETVVCTDVLNNSGTQAITAQTIRRLVVNLDTAVELSSEDLQISLVPGASQTLTRSVATQGFAEGRYGCVLQVPIEGAYRALDSAGFEVRMPPIRIDATIEVGTRGRLLILMDDPEHARDKDDDDDRDDDDDDREDDDNDWDDDDRDDGDREDDDDDDRDESSDANSDAHGPNGLPNESVQRTYLEAFLSEHGWSYTIVTHADDFERELRSGEYSAYVLFSEQVKLPKLVTSELREAVYRGEGLLEAGSHDQRQGRIDTALGIDYRGKTPNAVGFQWLGGRLALMQGGRFAVLDKGLKAKLQEGAQAEAVFGDPDVSPMSDAPIAVTTSEYGLGRTVYAGFDLLAQATAAADRTPFEALLLEALAYIQPDELLSVGRAVPMTLSLANQGVATPGQVVLTVPDGAVLTDPTGGEMDTDGRLVWPFDAQAGETLTHTFWSVFPAGGAASVSAEIFVGVAPQLSSHGVHDFSRELAEPVSVDDVQADLDAVAGDSAYRKARRKFGRAADALAEGKPESAVRFLIDVTDELAAMTSPESADLRLKIDQLIRQIEQQTLAK